MKPNHKLALYVAYYLAKFDKAAYEALDFGTQHNTHQSVGKILNINPHTLKNMRDEFDPVFGNRAGWHQRTMSPSRIQVMNALDGLDESEILSIVEGILYNDIEESDKDQLTSIISDTGENASDATFVARGVTGRQAEHFFANYFNRTRKPYDGILTDTRDKGCGYDFEITSEQQKYFIEVKGLKELTGGILFTNKEWRAASRYGDRYILAVVNDLRNAPNIYFIQNPFSILKARRKIYSVPQVQWTVYLSASSG